ncbi:hypothetical protein C7974DRAFT_476319 [Boeremia exigua]|uniref:uncharacterized protein n=1 Tax=Boeremia exigua TaxID=749465 RepID=UPI001E8D9F8C|nr:uncharacterized protein C7974DRAFT_476319 [Boeremia exigua]KAH6612441.1 hypothetical protein C7974DRAFT_476319 [Boeremia exigua]
MSLNKRTGLYSMPSHHIHAAKLTPRPTFNSMDFAAEEAKASQNRVQVVKDEKGEATPQERKVKKKKQSISAGDEQLSSRTPQSSTPLIKIVPATSSTKGKKEKKSWEKDAPQSDKKRKRASEDHAFAPVLPNSLSAVGADMLRNVQSSVQAARKVFSSPSAVAEHTEGPSKKKSKKDKTSRKSNDTIDFDRMAKETRSIDRQTRKEKKARRQSAGAIQALPPSDIPAAVFSSLPRKTPVPLPENAFSHSANANRIGRRDSRLLILETPLSQLPKTPVHLPDSPIPFKLTDAKSKTHTSSRVADPSPPTPLVADVPSSAPPALYKNHKLELNPDGRVSLTSSNLLQYTTTTQPLSDMPKPRLKPRSRAASAAGSTTSGGTTPSIKEMFARAGRKAAGNPFVVSGETVGQTDDTKSAKAKKKSEKKKQKNKLKAKKKEQKDNAQQMEKEKEKPAQHTPHATLDNSSANSSFIKHYAALQSTVDFAAERTHLAALQSWRAAAAERGPLPCLGQKASGCNAKRETVLRMRRQLAEDASCDAGSAGSKGAETPKAAKAYKTSKTPTTSTASMVSKTSKVPGETADTPSASATAADTPTHPPPDAAAAIASAHAHVATAESFLAAALTARVPVPRGPVEGVWRLYCAAYGREHVDRYGAGGRELRVWSSLDAEAETAATSSNAAAAADTSYTAALHIPPRSLPFTLSPFPFAPVPAATVAFALPAYASFRPHALRTSEGYAVEVVFLGGGCALVRVDVRLLLSGGVGGVMEFVGVRVV